MILDWKALAIDAAVIVGLTLIGTGFGYLQGRHSAELACANTAAAASAQALTQWKKAADEQRDIDMRLHDRDTLRAKAAAEQAEAIASRFERLRIAVVKMPPKGECTLTPEWITAYNAAK